MYVHCRMRALTFVPPTGLHVVFAQHSIRSPTCGTHDSPSVKQNASSLICNGLSPLIDAANEDLVDSDIKASVYTNNALRVRIVLVKVGQGHPSEVPLGSLALLAPTCRVVNFRRASCYYDLDQTS
ncbi:hypothetical protein AB1N83_000782 [Pleurotus pulmonarius]